VFRDDFFPQNQKLSDQKK